jgi:hypothetical protein
MVCNLNKLGRILTPNRIIGWACVVTATSILFYALFGGWMQRRDSFMTQVSPGGTYEVLLSGEPWRPLFLTNKVYFEVRVNQDQYLTERLLHSSDAFDLSFELGFPDNEWAYENVLHLYSKERMLRGRDDMVTIFNSSHKQIKYMKVESDDKLLIFDLLPGSKIAQSITGGGSDHQWIDCIGEFMDGKTFTGNATLERDGPTSYFIQVGDDNVVFKREKLPPE